MSKFQMVLAGLVLASFCAAAIGCPGFRSALLGAAEECGPGLIREVAEILIKEGWKADLSSKAADVGMGAVTCAVRAVLKNLNAAPSAAPASGLVLGMDIEVRTLMRARAQEWLAAQPIPAPPRKVVHPSHRITGSGGCSICYAQRVGDVVPLRLIRSCRGRCDDRA